MNGRKHAYYLASSHDNVATALVALCSGEQLVFDTIGSLAVRNDIPFGFKFALGEISKGDPIMKYGEPIGVASCAIKAGELVHVHNVESQRGRGDIAR